MKLNNLFRARNIISDIEDIVQEKISQYEEDSIEHQTLWEIWCELFKLYNITQISINDLLNEQKYDIIKKGGDNKWINTFITQGLCSLLSYYLANVHYNFYMVIKKGEKKMTIEHYLGEREERKLKIYLYQLLLNEWCKTDNTEDTELVNALKVILRKRGETIW